VILFKTFELRYKYAYRSNSFQNSFLTIVVIPTWLLILTWQSILFKCHHRWPSQKFSQKQLFWPWEMSWIF